MCPIQNLRFDQRLCYCARKTLAGRVGVLTEIGMVKEARATDLQFGSQFAEIRVHHIRFCVDERIETEHEVD